jgi:hypothetical protein
MIEQRNTLQDRSNKYVPPHLREGEAGHQDSNKKWESKCRYCGDKWSPGHKCNNKKLYTCEAEKESNTSDKRFR